MRKKNPNQSTANTPPDGSMEDSKCKSECDKTPSFFTCFPCFMNLNDKNVIKTDNDQTHSFEERINSTFSKLYNIDGLNSLSTQYRGVVTEDMRQLFIEMAKTITELNKRLEKQANPTDVILDKVRPMIPLEGFKGTNSKKIGYFMLNEFNKKGLRLSKTHAETITNLFIENFTDPDGGELSYRTFFDGIIAGANLKEDAKFPE